MAGLIPLQCDQTAAYGRNADHSRALPAPTGTQPHTRPSPPCANGEAVAGPLVRR
jgi:hypothetical protein